MAESIAKLMEDAVFNISQKEKDNFKKKLETESDHNCIDVANYTGIYYLSYHSSMINIVHFS